MTDNRSINFCFGLLKEKPLLSCLQELVVQDLKKSKRGFKKGHKLLEPKKKKVRVQERESGDEAEIQTETLSTPTINPPVPKPSSRSKPKLMNLYDTNCGGNCGVWEATSRACDC